MKKILSIAVTLVMMITCIPVTSAFAEDDYIDIRIDGALYEHVTGTGEVVIGDVDPEKANIEIVSYNGNALNNVGTKSG